MIPATPDLLLGRRPWNAVIDGRDAKESDCSDGIQGHGKFERLLAQDKEYERGDDDRRSCPKVKPTAELGWCLNGAAASGRGLHGRNSSLYSPRPWVNRLSAYREAGRDRAPPRFTLKLEKESRNS